MTVFGMVAAIAGVVVFHVSLGRVLAQNPHRRIGLFRRGDEIVPRGTVPLRALGAALFVLGAILLAMFAWYWPFIVIAAGPGVATLRLIVHNSRAAKSARTDAA